MCICRWNGSVWECKIIYPEDFCKWFDCEGTGEGGDWKKQVSLDCGLPVTRGQFASCTVETGNGLNRNLLTSHWFAWEMGTSKSGGLEWGGTATETTEIEVALTMAVVGETVNLRETVQVRPRDWGLRTQHAVLQWVDPIPRRPNAWGLYSVDIERAVPLWHGSGPWEGRHIILHVPQIGPSAMYAHKDLRPDGKPYAIPDTDTICGLSGVSRSVYQLNDACGRGTRLANFKAYVEAHERYHQNSLNACIRSVNAGRFRALESVVGTVDYVQRQLTNRWMNSIRPDLIQAARTAQGPVRVDIWHWRANRRWVDGGQTPGHTGTNGCTG